MRAFAVVAHAGILAGALDCKNLDIDPVKGVFYSPKTANAFGRTSKHDPYELSSRYMHRRDMPAIRDLDANTIFLAPWDQESSHADFLTLAMQNDLCVVPAFDVSQSWRDGGWQGSEVELDLRRNLKSLIESVKEVPEAVAAVNIHGLPDAMSLLPRKCIVAELSHNLETCIAVQGEELDLRIRTTQDILKIIFQEFREADEEFCNGNDTDTRCGPLLGVNIELKSEFYSFSLNHPASPLKHNYLEHLAVWLERVVGCWPVVAGPVSVNSTRACANGGRGYLDFWSLSILLGAEEAEVEGALRATEAFNATKLPVLLSYAIPRITGGRYDPWTQHQLLQSLYEGAMAAATIWGVVIRGFVDDPEAPLRHAICAAPGLLRPHTCGPWSPGERLAVGSTGLFVQHSFLMQYCIMAGGEFSFIGSNRSQDTSDGDVLRCAPSGFPGGFAFYLFCAVLLPCLCCPWNVLKRCLSSLTCGRKESSNAGMREGAPESKELSNEPYGRWLAVKVADALQSGLKVPLHCEQFRDRTGWGLEYCKKKGNRSYFRYFRFKGSWMQEVANRQNETWKSQKKFVKWLSKQTDRSMHVRGYSKNEGMSVDLVGVNVVTRSRLTQVIQAFDDKKDTKDKKPKEIIESDSASADMLDMVKVQVTLTCTENPAWLSGVLAGRDTFTIKGDTTEGDDMDFGPEDEDIKVTEEEDKGVKDKRGEATREFLSFAAKSHLDVQAKVAQGLIEQEAALLEKEAGGGAGDDFLLAASDKLWRKCFQGQKTPEDLKGDLENYVAEIVLLYFLQSIGEHCLHCPRYLNRIRHKAVTASWGTAELDPPKEPGDGPVIAIGGPVEELKEVKAVRYRIDYDKLRDALSDIAENSDTFVRGKGQGKNFDDIDDSEIGKVEKTFHEPVGAWVIAHLLVNFQWPITIVIWLTTMALVHASVMAKTDGTRPAKDSWYVDSRWFLRFDLVWAVFVKFIELKLPFEFPMLPFGLPFVSRAPPVWSSGSRVCARWCWFLVDVFALLVCAFLLALEVVPEKLAFVPIGGYLEEDSLLHHLLPWCWLTLRLSMGIFRADLSRNRSELAKSCSELRASLKTCRMDLCGQVERVLMWVLPQISALVLGFSVLRLMLVPVLRSLTPEGLCGFGKDKEDFCSELSIFPWLPPRCITCLVALGGLWLLSLIATLMIPGFLFDLLASLIGSLLGAKRGFSPTGSSEVDLQSKACEEISKDFNDNMLADERRKTAERMSHGTLSSTLFGERGEDAWKCLVEGLYTDRQINNDQRELLKKGKAADIGNAIANLSETARERIDLFFQGLRAVIADVEVGFNPSKDSLDKAAPFPSVTQIIPVYGEEIQVPFQSLAHVDGATSLLEFLIGIYKPEWDQFARQCARDPLETLADLFRRGKKPGQLPEESEITEDERSLITQVRRWASHRSQTVIKTVEGALQLQKALRVLTGDKLAKGVQLIVAHQTYGHCAKPGQREKDVHAMLEDHHVHTIPDDDHPDEILQVCVDYNRQKIHPKLTELVDDYSQARYGCSVKFLHASVLLEYDDDRSREDPEWPVKIIHVLPRAYPLRIGSQKTNLSQGKAANHLGALRFATCLYLQLLDANMGCDAEEAFKVPIVLQMFRRRPEVCMIGFPEKIFTADHGLIGMCTAEGEANFGRAVQRWLGWLKVRMNYGHPDFLDAVWARCSGSMSKASPHINLSEDIFAGFTAWLKGTVSAHTDHHRVAKGREVVFLSAAGFTRKIASGSVGVARSRDLQRLCSVATPIQATKLYFATVGFYVQQSLAELSTRLYLGSFLMLALSSKSTADLGALNILLTVEWMLTPALIIFASIVRGLCEKQFLKWCQDYARYIPVLIPYHNFMNKVVADTFIETVFTNVAEYVNTGRPHASKHYALADTFAQFWTSHYEQAVSYLYFLLAFHVSQRGGGVPMILVTLNVLSWIAAPVLYRPPPSPKASFEDMRKACSFVAGIKPESSAEIKERSLYELMLNKETKRSRRPYLGELFLRILGLGLFVIALDATIWNHVKGLIFVWAVGVGTHLLGRHFRLEEGTNFLALSALLVLLSGMFVPNFVADFDMSCLLFAGCVFLFVAETIKMSCWLVLDLLLFLKFPINLEQSLRLGFDGCCKGQLLLLSASVVVLFQAALECLLLLLDRLPWKLRTRLILGSAMKN